MIDGICILLGFLQGLTEFLPVSSSGHLFLLEKLLNSRKADLSFVLILHTATFLSVFAVFFKDIKVFLFGLQKKKNLALFFKILISLLPLFVIGVLFKASVEQSFEKTTVALGFLSSGLLMLSLLFIRKKNLCLEEMSFIQAFLIGLAQALAVLPGFSRSGWTIAIGLYCGLAPRTAVYYSFLISLPAIAGSALMDWALHFSKSHQEEFFLFSVAEFDFSLFLSFLTAFFSGFLSLLLVLKIVQCEKLYLFSFYLLPLSVLVFLFL